jgi:hypothetical protein
MDSNQHGRMPFANLDILGMRHKAAVRFGLDAEVPVSELVTVASSSASPDLQ